jgi:anti-sigma-K factor RskA
VTDPFVHDDAAYVLGALSTDERERFEAHMTDCAACAERVQEIAGIPALLDGLTAADIEHFAGLADATGPDRADPVPNIVLPRLLKEVAARRRRQRWLVGGLAAAVAACLVALTVTLWPAQSSSSGPPSAERPFSAVVASPVRASATLTAKAWGTAIDVHCHYLPGTVPSPYSYDMWIADRTGHRERVGSWRLPTDKDISFATGTALQPAQISTIDIILSDGEVVLRLTL